MQDRIAYKKNIKDKAEFIYLNSGIILSKLEDDYLRPDAENNLQIILFFDTKLGELSENVFNLLNRTCPVFHGNNYSSAIAIIFHMANMINECEFLEDGKERLRDQLRRYTEYFPYEQDDLVKNKKYVRLYEKN